VTDDDESSRATSHARSGLPRTPPVHVERPQDRAAKTRVTKTRIRIFASFVRLARRSQQRQLTVAAICRQAGVSQSAFYNNFDRGVEELLMVVIEQIADAIRRDLDQQLARDPNAHKHIERTVITTTRMIEFLARYPNLFYIDGIVPRDAIVTLSRPLSESIAAGRVLSDAELENINDMAKYHATALIGVMRSGLGKNTPQSQYVERLRHAALLQIVPALMYMEDPQTDARLESAAESHGPVLLRLMSLPSVTRLADKVARSIES
jgi:AcrR family transcriptional regulator